MDEASAGRYLGRISAQRPREPSAEALRQLQLRHLTAVPFETLSIHLGEPIALDEEALLDKVVSRHRGGFCYELNGLFAGLLRALGYPVTLLGARVFEGDELGPPFEHLVLQVAAGGPWLVDVGFGDHCLHPLRLDAGGPQADPAGTFQVVAGDGEVTVLREGRPVYVVELRPRVLADFVPTCWWTATSPDSGFRRGPVCSRAVVGGRVTLAGRRLIRTSGGNRIETELDTDQAVLAAYQAEFGIRLPRVPSLAPGADLARRR